MDHKRKAQWRQAEADPQGAEGDRIIKFAKRAKGDQPAYEKVAKVGDTASEKKAIEGESSGLF